MSVTSVVLTLGIIAYVIVRQVCGELLHIKRTVVLPAVLTAAGFAQLHLTHGHVAAADITCLLLSAAGSALIGCGFGALMQIESRGGYLWARLRPVGLWLWVLMVAWRLLMTGVAGAMHAHIAASTSTMLLTLGINRLAQAAVIVPRAMSKGIPFAPDNGSGGLLGGLLGGGGQGGRSGGLLQGLLGGGDAPRRDDGYRDRYGADQYSRDQYARDQQFARDQAARDQYARDQQYARDRYEQDRYEQDRYEQDRYDRGRDSLLDRGRDSLLDRGGDSLLGRGRGRRPDRRGRR